MKRHIPNVITCLNLLSGSIAVYLAASNQFVIAFMFILLGAFFDFWDGLVARKLGVSSKLGIEMDSLADDITFGLAPSMMLMCYLKPIIGWWALIALLMAAFSALRLGKFNIDERQTSSFLGLATPANAIFWGSITCLPYQAVCQPWMPWCLLAISLLSCWLLVCEIPFCSLKFKSFGWRDNYDKYVFLMGTLMIIIGCSIKAFIASNIHILTYAGALIILWYVLVNVTLSIIGAKK
jgi:CDP-diacylglycerol--serine O-phosphatidyltransferase